MSKTDPVPQAAHDMVTLALDALDGPLTAAALGEARDYLKDALTALETLAGPAERNPA